MLTLNDNLLPAGNASVARHRCATPDTAGSIPAACSKLSGKAGGTGPAALGARGQGVAGSIAVFQIAGPGSSPGARSYDLEVRPAGLSDMLGRPVNWCPPIVHCDGPRAGAQVRLQNAPAGFDTSAACQEGHDRRQHRFQDHERR